MARVAVLLLGFALGACGGVSSRSTPQQTGGTGSGGGGSTGGRATGGRATGGSGAGGASCTGYDDQLGTSVRVSMLNKTDAPIYLGAEMVTCGAAPLFHVVGADGTPLPTFASCRLSCTTVQQGVVGCADICLFPTSIELQPGEARNVLWDGLFPIERDLPLACVTTDFDVSLHCDQAQRIEPGTFTFSARAGTALDCSQTTGGACQPCMSDGDGGCSTPGSLIGGKFLKAGATVQLDAHYGVYESAPSENPGAGASPGAGDPIEQLTVELVFTNF